MTPLRINGHRIPCRACGRHDAKVDYMGICLCTACFRAFAIGVHVGRIEYRHAQVRHITEGME